MSAEKVTEEQKLNVRQDFGNQRLSIIPPLVFASILGVGVSSLFLAAFQPKPELNDHPMCGFPTGGKVCPHQ